MCTFVSVDVRECGWEGCEVVAFGDEGYNKEGKVFDEVMDCVF